MNQFLAAAVCIIVFLIGFLIIAVPAYFFFKAFNRSLKKKKNTFKLCLWCDVDAECNEITHGVLMFLGIIFLPLIVIPLLFLKEYRKKVRV